MVKSKTKIDQQSQKKHSFELVETIRAAKKTGNNSWLKVASILTGPRRMRTAINLNEIEKMSKEGEIVIVPGKVLSQGEISKKISIVAFNFSESAKEKILKSKSQALTIMEEIKKNPEAKGIKILAK